MTETPDQLRDEVLRRRTFAIISHPDAGKTTLTEKLLLYGGAIHLAGAVKQKKATRHATSDWMALEQERGISVSTSVMQFDYLDHSLNLLDTPGHNDFSEDTYRTLSAVDCAVMLIDNAKGVEPQTIKLFKVCRMRNIPIVTFVNKMDRYGRDLFEVLDEIESVLGIPCSPVNWPVGSGPEFQGVYDRGTHQLLRFEKVAGGSKKAALQMASLEDPALVEAIGEYAYRQLVDELALLEGAGAAFDQDAFLAGKVTPVFFGSAMNNFGVEFFLNRFIDLAPSPLARMASHKRIDPLAPEFSGFVFKIQANMDPKHRDRIAFVRICSGRFQRGMSVRHARTGKSLNLTKPLQFMAQKRTLIDEAYSGDIIGLWDAGNLKIGDTLCEGELIEFEGIPRFSPEHFVVVRLEDALRRKRLRAGLEQLSEEGAVQVFLDRHRLERDPILGAVGMLQFDVIQYRLKAEYQVEVRFDSQPYQFARWIEGDDFDPDRFERQTNAPCVLDLEGRPLALFDSEWRMQKAADVFPKLQFIAAIQPARSHTSR